MNNFTDEEIALVNKHREQQEKIAMAAEALRRKQVISKSIADLLDQAKQILIDAKQVAVDNGMQYEIGDMAINMVNEVSDNQYWYGSDQSHC